MRRGLLLAVVLVFGGCGGDDKGTNAGEGEFGIYLTELDVEPEKLVVMSHIDPAGEPILSTADIAAYHPRPPRFADPAGNLQRRVHECLADGGSVRR